MDVKFNVIPNMAARSLTLSTKDYEKEIEQVKAALAQKLIAENGQDGIVLANGYQYETQYNLGPAWKVNDGRVKTWWKTEAFEGVFVAHNADGSWATVANTDSDPGLQWTTRELQDFFKLYRSHFPRIPKFVTRSFTAEEAGRAQFGDGPGVDFPLAKVQRSADTTASFRSTFPPDTAVVVKDGELLWFKISEYKAAFPLTVTAKLPPPVKVPDEILLVSVSMVLQQGGTAAEKVARLRALFG